MLDREGLPQEIKDKKIAELRALKKEQKQKKEAVKFSDRYKKIKFIEKRKVIRKLEQFDKGMRESGADVNKLRAEKREW